MKLKKYEASTEQEAIRMVKDELGLDALILNVKRVKPKGLFALFKKPYVEITAAYEDKPFIKIEDIKDNEEVKTENINKSENESNFDQLLTDNTKNEEHEKIINNLENKLSETEDMLNKFIGQLSELSTNPQEKNKYDNPKLQFFYNMLISQGVTVEISDKLLENIDEIDDFDKLDINLIVKIVYNRIINILGEPVTISFDKDSKFAKNIVFIGPTGVGKTTTIAKLSSNFMINEGARVGFITADTYRIAAIEQLKIYADILGSDVGIVYNVEDMKEQIDMRKVVNDLIFIDTAGRSHKNIENFEELEQLLNAIPDPEIYLVLSITTRYEDLLSIIAAYSQIADFRIIFTKLDETTSIGSILNISYITGKEISYISDGQNAPDDIDIFSPEKIAKALLGSMYR